MRYSDIATAPAVKYMNALEGLRYLKVAEKTGFKSAYLYNWKGYALKRLSKVDDALEASTMAYEIAQEDPYERGRALYNSSCYLALLNRKVDALSKLKKAIDEDPEWKDVARNDEDFQKSGVSEEPEFQELVAE